MKLSCLLVDDEPLARELLQDNIRQVPFLELKGQCKNALEALEFLRKEPVDLIFLDIQMPGITGLQLIQSLQEKPMIILITAYEQYALESYSLDVIDYLVKPVSLDRFVKACNKALDFFNLKQAAQGGNVGGEDPGYFFVNAEYSLVKVVTDEIILVEGLKDYIKIHLEKGKPLVIRMSMKTIEEKLPTRKFLRVHKSFIVSLAKITSIRKGSVFLGTQEVPVSDTYRDLLMEAVGHKGH